MAKESEIRKHIADRTNKKIERHDKRRLKTPIMGSSGLPAPACFIVWTPKLSHVRIDSEIRPTCPAVVTPPPPVPPVAPLSSIHPTRWGAAAPQDAHLRSKTVPGAPGGSILGPRTKDLASRGHRNLRSGGTLSKIRATLYVHGPLLYSSRLASRDAHCHCQLSRT